MIWFLCLLLLVLNFSDSLETHPFSYILFCFVFLFFWWEFAGISLKTQELYAIVFATRYLDIFTTFISVYNTIMKLIFLGSSFSIIWYIRRHKIVRRSYDKDQDTFRHIFLMWPCLIFAIFINEKFTFKEVSSFHFVLLIHLIVYHLKLFVNFLFLILLRSYSWLFLCLFLTYHRSSLSYYPLSYVVLLNLIEQVVWAFSIYLEAVAILPQLVLLQRTRNIDNLTGQYVFLLG